jgi:hypothetical protein
VLTHLSSESATCPGSGWSQIAVRANEIDVINDFVLVNHDWTTQAWDVTRYLVHGKNEIELEMEDGCTNYWIKRAEITASLPAGARLDPKSAPIPVAQNAPPPAIAPVMPPAPTVAPAQPPSLWGCSSCGRKGTFCDDATCRLQPDQTWKATMAALAVDFTRGAPQPEDARVCLRKAGTQQWFCSSYLSISSRYRDRTKRFVYAIGPTEAAWVKLQSRDLVKPGGVDIHVELRGGIARRTQPRSSHAAIVASDLLFNGGLKLPTHDEVYPSVTVRLTPLD